jgi:ribosomal protein S12 methylthiotransferase
MLAQQEIAFEMNEALIGRTMDVLIDEPTEESDLWIGRTRYQAPDVDSVTIVSGDDLSVGRIVEARIVGSNDYDLLAER